MIDPVIVETEGRDTAEEGCLSIPDIFGDVTRPERVVLEALDRDGSRSGWRPPASRPAPSSTRSTTSTASSSSTT